MPSNNNPRIIWMPTGNISDQQIFGATQNSQIMPSNVPIDLKLLKSAEDKLIAKENFYGTHYRANRRSLNSRQEEFMFRRQFSEINKLKLIWSEIPIALNRIPGRTENNLALLQPRVLQNQAYQSVCFECHQIIPLEYTFVCNGKMWCSIHTPISSITCRSCGRSISDKSSIKIIKGFDNRNFAICSTCFMVAEYKCIGCSKILTKEYWEYERCSNCLIDQAAPFRDFSYSMKWAQGVGIGEIVRSPRIYAAELECVISKNRLNKISSLLPKEVGISTDGSIRTTDEEKGIEIQTPRLSGLQGEELINQITGVLNSADATINKSCGLHLHLEGSEFLPFDRRLYPRHLIDLWLAYLVFEDVLFSFVPYGRKNNNYCQFLNSAFNYFEVWQLHNLAEIERYWYGVYSIIDLNGVKREKHHPSRYFGINFHSLFTEGHLEIRLHSGTVSYRKILEWANLHATIMDFAMLGGFTEDILNEARAVSLQERTKMLLNILGLSGSSKRWFLERQKKFSNKNNLDD